MNEKGFTLVEIMFVMIIVVILLLITIPNVAKYTGTVDERGCNGYVKMLEGAIEAYRIEHKKVPTSIKELQQANYLGEETTCPDGRKVTILPDGQVSVHEK